MQTQPTTQLDELLELTHQQAHEIDSLKERIQLLLAQLYSSKSEKLPLPPADQLSFLEAQLEELQAQKAATVEVLAHQRKASGRKALPEELPRVEVLHDLPEAEKTCACGAELSKIGEETSEQLEYIPPQLRVLRHIRPKYTCRACEGVEGEGPTIKIAPSPQAHPAQKYRFGGTAGADRHRQVCGFPSLLPPRDSV